MGRKTRAQLEDELKDLDSQIKGWQKQCEGRSKRIEALESLRDELREGLDLWKRKVSDLSGANITLSKVNLKLIEKNREMEDELKGSDDLNAFLIGSGLAQAELVKMLSNASKRADEMSMALSNQASSGVGILGAAGVVGGL